MKAIRKIYTPVIKPTILALKSLKYNTKDYKFNTKQNTEIVWTLSYYLVKIENKGLDVQVAIIND